VYTRLLKIEICKKSEISHTWEFYIATYSAAEFWSSNINERCHDIVERTQSPCLVFAWGAGAASIASLRVHLPWLLA
jgi:hypothetical protein